jgi:hypothetical protein
MGLMRLDWPMPEREEAGRATEPKANAEARISGTVVITDDWFEPGELEPRRAWVVEWIDPDDEIPMMHRALVELGGAPAEEESRREELIAKADAVIAQGQPPQPAGFGFAATGSETRAELFERVKLTFYAVDDASGRVGSAARRTDDAAANALSVALVEMTAWLRGLDELMSHIWQHALTVAVRERASQATDESLNQRKEPPPGELVAEITARERNGNPYKDWTFALLAKGAYLSRDELQGLRWLAGKLLHFGPLPAAELRHWRAGAGPRWKWRAADELFPLTLEEQRPTQRAAYEKHLRGQDIVGTVSFITTLIEAEFLFYRLLRDSDEEEGLTWAGT